MADTYSMNYACGNCGHAGELSLPRGSRAAEKVCPHCGVWEFTPQRLWGTGPFVVPRRIGGEPGCGPRSYDPEVRHEASSALEKALDRRVST